MEIALFGGSFDPPHVGHLLAAAYVLATEPVDELWFVPVFGHPLGKPLHAPFEHRAGRRGPGPRPRAGLAGGIGAGRGRANGGPARAPAPQAPRPQVGAGARLGPRGGADDVEEA